MEQANLPQKLNLSFSSLLKKLCLLHPSLGRMNFKFNEEG
jgi:hypothetical protein